MGKTRFIKIVCVNDGCNFLEQNDRPYSVRGSRLVIESGLPYCGSCAQQMEEDTDVET